MMVVDRLDGTCWAGPDLVMAFQPIVDISAQTVFGYEALVRGVNGEGAETVLSHVTPANFMAFEAACHSAAMASAGRLGLDRTHHLSLNFLPSGLAAENNSVSPALAMANASAIGTDQLIVEITEAERVTQPVRIAALFADYRRLGLKTAIDDFGVGYAGLGLLADFQPDYIKIAMDLVRDVHESRPRASITRAILQAARDLSIQVIAEGVESPSEVAALRAQGVTLFQGFLFARPTVDRLIPPSRICFPAARSVRRLARPPRPTLAGAQPLPQG